MTDLTTWMLDNNDRMFSVRKYQKIYTPKEQQACYIDESRYEWDKICKIEEAIEIPNDVLLGLSEYIESTNVDDDNTITTTWQRLGDLLYVRLSDVQIERLEEDYYV